MPDNSKPIVSFECLKCSQPLKLDPQLNEHDQSTSPRKDQEAILHTHGDATEFAFLGLPNIQTEEIFSRAMMTNNHLHDVLLGEADIDHPLCEECTDNLMNQLEQKLSQAKIQHEQYSMLIEKLEQAVEDENLLDKELEELTRMEVELERRTEEMLRKESETKEELEMTKKSKQKYHDRYNECKRQLFEVEDSKISLSNDMKYANKMLESMAKSNAFSLAFDISCGSPIATINRFRMGRLPGLQVDWNEINAGWGQAALLLHSIANKVGLAFKKYKVVPYGKRSHLQSTTDKSKEYPLFTLGKFKDAGFDAGAIAFLDCLRQLKEELERKSTNSIMPCAMDSSGHIQDSTTGVHYTIKLMHPNSEKEWTEALKLMLKGLKWCLSWISLNVSPGSNEETLPTSMTRKGKKSISNDIP